MAKGRYLYDMPWFRLLEQLEKTGKSLEDISKGIESLDEEDYDDIQYIDLVYPPGSNPPTRNSFKKMNLIGFNHRKLK